MNHQPADFESTHPLISAWVLMMAAYAAVCVMGFLVGSLLIHVGLLAPDAVFDISTKRISYFLPVVDRGVAAGIDPGLIIFFWNALGVLATISFIYTAAWFNPRQGNRFPRMIRSIFCIPKPMRLLCYLPGCRRYEAESIRRLYIWLMIPLLGIMLLGMENGLSISTAATVLGSYLTGVLSLVTHGVIEIPMFTLAGALAYSAHRLVRRCPHPGDVQAVFTDVANHRRQLPVKRILGMVVFGLFIAGWIEMHVTEPLIARLVG